MLYNSLFALVAIYGAVAVAAPQGGYTNKCPKSCRITSTVSTTCSSTTCPSESTVTVIPTTCPTGKPPITTTVSATVSEKCTSTKCTKSSITITQSCSSTKCPRRSTITSTVPATTVTSTKNFTTTAVSTTTIAAGTVTSTKNITTTAVSTTTIPGTTITSTKNVTTTDISTTTIPATTVIATRNVTVTADPVTATASATPGPVVNLIAYPDKLCAVNPVARAGDVPQFQEHELYLPPPVPGQFPYQGSSDCIKTGQNPSSFSWDVVSFGNIPADCTVNFYQGDSCFNENNGIIQLGLVNSQNACRNIRGVRSVRVVCGGD